MSRYIDADKLLETIKQHNYRLRDICNTVDYGMYTVGIEQAIAEQPTVEIEPIKHCKPIRVGGSWACSNCDWGLTSLIYSYCPYCGAKIDEVTK